jgi:ATP-dependent Lhr-like helicase
VAPPVLHLLLGRRGQVVDRPAREVPLDVVREGRVPEGLGGLRLELEQPLAGAPQVLGEGIAGGFASVYPVLRAMEEAGRVRRGYFVDGLGAAQFALPGAVDRLRAARDDDGASVLVLAATDPAQPYGAALPWPRRTDEERLQLQRVPGAYLVLVNGAPALYVERGGRGLIGLPAFDGPDVRRFALAAIPRLLTPAGPMRELRLERVDRLPVGQSALADELRELGFRPSYRAWLLQPQ